MNESNYIDERSPFFSTYQSYRILINVTWKDSVNDFINVKRILAHYNTDIYNSMFSYCRTCDDIIKVISDRDITLFGKETVLVQELREYNILKENINISANNNQNKSASSVYNDNPQVDSMELISQHDLDAINGIIRQTISDVIPSILHNINSAIDGALLTEPQTEENQKTKSPQK